MPLSIHGTNGITFNDGSTQNTRPAVGFRNRIINGAMMIDQRNAGASVTPAVTDTYSLDRYLVSFSASSKFSFQQSTTAPAGFINSLLFTSLAATSVGSTDQYRFEQRIEGLNVADLGWGTANAQTVTLSFWARSSLTGTFGGALVNSAANRSYPFSFTINSANTFEYKTVTIAGDTTGTWLTTNGIGIGVRFSLGCGSTFKGTAGAWSASNLIAPTGAVDLVATNGATFYITGVQLEAGSTATDFERRPYGTELALCQRYYQKSYSHGVVPNTATAIGVVGGVASGANYMPVSCSLPVIMRSNATFSVISASGTNGAISASGNNDRGSSFVVDQPSDSRIVAVTGAGSALTAGTFYYFHFTASSEL